MQNMDWYHSLNKPFLNPPDWIFQQTWTVLYILIFLSLFIFLKNGKFSKKILPLTAFMCQMVLNILWSFIFFNFQNIFAALIICVLLCFLIVITILSFYKHSKIAAYLLIPYFLWVCFALYLNYRIWILN